MTTSLARLALGTALVLSLGHCKRAPPESTPPPSPPAAPAPRTEGAPPPPPTATIDPPAAASEFRDAAQWLPQGEVAGWRQTGEVTRSSAANLFQIIDGEAPSYQQYGLRNFAKTDYRRTTGTQLVTVNVFEFEAPLGAFGRYTLMVANGRDPSTLQPQAVARGGGGYQGTTQLNFWKGRHLVQITVSDVSDTPDEGVVANVARDALPRFAEAMERLIPGETHPPPSPLPSEGLVWGGATYLADGLYGVEHTGPAWVGHYRDAAGKRYRLAVLARISAAEAQRAMTRLRTGHPSPLSGLGDEAFTNTNEANGEIVAARRGTTIYVIADGGAPGLTPLDRAGKTAVLRAMLGTPATSTATH